jgi:N-acetylglutamate synthase-like GNAT family acetyltransferase
MILIRPFTPSDAQGVAEVIVSIQREEFWIAITLAQQPDLSQIPAFYQRGLGNFWVAEAAGEIVGTIGLVDIGDRHVALRKLFVKASHRGREQGVAQRLLETALAWCAAHGVTEVYLGTTALFLAAHRFYERNGFVEVAPERLPPNFPRMTVDTRFYRLPIGGTFVERILPETWADWRDGLSQVLIDCVDAGASISFLPPLDRATADAF